MLMLMFFGCLNFWFVGFRIQVFGSSVEPEELEGEIRQQRMLENFAQLMDVPPEEEGLTVAGKSRAQECKLWLSSVHYIVFREMWRDYFTDSDKKFICWQILDKIKTEWDGVGIDNDGERRWLWSGLCYKGHEMCSEDAESCEHVDLMYLLFCAFVFEVCQMCARGC